MGDRIGIRELKNKLSAILKRVKAGETVVVTDRLARHAGALAEGHALRGFDAIHLASAMEAEHLLGQPITFFSYDQRQQQAAGTLGLELALVQASQTDSQSTYRPSASRATVQCSL